MISLAIISRKEDEESLNKAIQSVGSYVDEIVVANTSEKADLVFDSDICPFIKVARFKWADDFAAARNFSFEQCSGDVIFWIDSDDTVTGAENLPILAREITDGKCDWIYCRYNYRRDEHGILQAVHWRPRLFRKGTVKWEKSVHEDATPTTGVIQAKDEETGLGTVVIEHNSTKAEQESEVRNLGILMAEYHRDKDHTDPRTIQYLGMTLEGLERYQEAVPFYTAHIERTGSVQDKYWSLHRLSGCLFHLGDSRSAVSVCMDALKLFPEWATAYFDLASIYYDLGQWAKVIEWTLVGMDKQVPDTLNVLNPQDYGLLPQLRLIEAFLYENRPRMALEAAETLHKSYPDHPLVRERYGAAKEAVGLEDYVASFLKVAGEFRKADRIKAARLFDLIPANLDNDVRIQQARKLIVPPTVWGEKSIVIYCGDSLEEWAYPSVFTGIGGSETAVIRMSEQLAKAGYEVTVYNRCGKFKGTYNGVEYKPYYYFDERDSFNVLVSWRNPGLFVRDLSSKKKYLWLHDILYPEAINETVIRNVDKILFLSKWHSRNVPGIPEDKIFITNNGINPEEFQNLPEKRPNSMVWSSSYDRGLLPFIRNILPLIKKEIPDVTLDVAYGWQNIEKEMEQIPSLRTLYDELSPILEHTPGITHHGRISHRKLHELMGSTMVYPYASEFGETNNMTSQECQAAGCFVITTSQAGGTPEKVHYGKVIRGDGIYTDKKLQETFAQEVIYALTLPTEPYEKVISKLTKEFSWEATAKQWVRELL